ncbi:hypothetical protein [Streptomyces sp. DSM 40484]|uniref:hypothetical protein n=1 Tax=Streptomyces kroppenstedtii TaxID=3051181 RepID=UPI0028D6B7A1|nr:hypothetical protein [Streptomyces sp. DSM 40484]
MSATADRYQEPHPPDSAPQRLLLVCPSTRLVREAVAAGFAVRVLADASLSPDSPDFPDSPDDGVPASIPVDLVDLTDEGAVAEAIDVSVRVHGTQRLLAFAGTAALPAVARTAARLGVTPNPADAARLLGEPVAMRALLNGSRHSYVPAAQARTAQELPAAVEEIGAPVTVRTLPPSARTAACPSGAPGDRAYLVERYLEGPEYGVVTLTADGMHRVVGVVALHGAWHPSSHLFPAPLGERDEAEARAIATELLDLAGYEFGYAYTVVVLTADGPRVVRSRADYPDEPLASLIELATGFGAEAELVQALAGKPVDVPTADRYAAVASYRLPVGRLLSVSGLEAVSELPGVHRVHFPYASGDDIPGQGGGADGYVLLSAESTQAAAETVTAAGRLLRAEVSRRPDHL